MSIPQTVFEVAVLIAFVIPGFVYTATRRWLRGGPTPDERDFSVRLVHGIAVGVALTSAYLVLAGHWIDDYLTEPAEAHAAIARNPEAVGGLLLLLGVIVPTGLALLGQVRLIRTTNRIRVGIKFVRSKSRIPTAWDYIATRRADVFVKVRRADGTWVGGYLRNGKDFVSMYPEARDIFIGLEYEMNPDGSFGDIVEGTAGVYVPLSGSETISWSYEAES